MRLRNRSLEKKTYNWISECYLVLSELRTKTLDECNETIKDLFKKMSKNLDDILNKNEIYKSRIKLYMMSILNKLSMDNKIINETKNSNIRFILLFFNNPQIQLEFREASKLRNIINRFNKEQINKGLLKKIWHIEFQYYCKIILGFLLFLCITILFGDFDDDLPFVPYILGTVFMFYVVFFTDDYYIIK